MNGTRLYLVRHGMTEWNDGGKMQGKTDIPLNGKGILQAEFLARRLAQRRKIKAIYTSPLIRAKSTAEIISAVLKIEVIDAPALQEVDFGEWEGLTLEEIRAGWGDALELWYEGKTLPPGGEGIFAMQRRVVECVEAIANKHIGEEILLVAHGGPIRAFLCHILGTIKPFRKIKQGNANINILDFSEEWGWQIFTINDICHLSEELHSDMEMGY